MKIEDLPQSIQEKASIILEMIEEKHNYRIAQGNDPRYISLPTFILEKKGIYHDEADTILKLLAQEGFIINLSWRADPRVHPRANEGEGYWPEGVDFWIDEIGFQSFRDKIAEQAPIPLKNEAAINVTPLLYFNAESGTFHFGMAQSLLLVCLFTGHASIRAFLLLIYRNQLPNNLLQIMVWFRS